LYDYGDLKTEGFWGHDLDLLGSRGVTGHVTTHTRNTKKPYDLDL